MLNYKRLVPRTLAASVYVHNNEKLTNGEADKINDGSFIEDTTSINGECITAQEVNQKLSQENKHVNYMIGGDDTNELVCYYTWSADTVDPTGVHIPDLAMIVEDRRLLSYEITPSNADVSSAEFSITSGSDIAHIDGSYVVADAEGSATYKVVINGSIEATATITVSNKPEEFPDDAEHRWIEVSPTESTISASGGVITVTGSYGLTGTYGTRKKIGDISDTITIEANTETTTKSGSKTYYYNNNQFDTPTADITWTQEAYVEQYTYTYDIKVGLDSSNITNDSVTVVFGSDEYGQDNKKSIYVKAVKNKVTSSGIVESTEDVNFSIRQYNSDKFVMQHGDKVLNVYATQENTSVSDRNVTSFQIYIDESGENYCYVTLVQEKKGIQVISGDAIMFTYNWTTGKDLDQATYVITNSDSDGHYNYSGYFGRIDGAQSKFLYFAGDNTGRGNEYAFVDFKSIAKWLEENGGEQSNIPGKTILEANTGSDGLVSIQCNLYTVWYNTKESEDITLSYTVYDKTSDNASVKADNNNKTFILTGYTQHGDSNNSPALCYAHGTRLHEINPDTCYTLSAKFVYYFNSGVFTFQTNDGNVQKWQKGYEYTKYPTTLNPTVTLSSFDVANGIVSAEASIQNLNLPENATLSQGSVEIDLKYYRDNDTVFISNTNQRITIDETTSFPVNLITNVNTSTIQNDIGSGTFDIFPYVTINMLYDDVNHVEYTFNNVSFSENKKQITL